MLRVTVAEKGGAEREQFFDVSDLSIGRVQGNSIVLPKPNVSKRHATVTLEGVAVTIADQKSTNGTYVNGRRISGPRALSPEDRVYIGDFTLRFAQVAATGDMEPTPVPPLPIDTLDMMPHRPTISMSAFSPETAGAAMPPIPDEASVQTEVPLEFDVEVAPPPPPDAPIVDRSPDSTAARADSGEIAVTSRVASVTAQSQTLPPTAHPMFEGSFGGRSQMSGLARRVQGAGADRGSLGRWAEALRLVSDEAESSVFADVRMSSTDFSDEQWQRMSDGVMRLVDRLRREDRLPSDVDPFLLTQDVLYEFTGLGPFEELLADEQVRTIVVDAIDRLWVGRGGRPVPVAKAFASEATQERVLARLLDLAGLPVDGLTQPQIAGRLPDGTTLRIINFPLAAEGRLVVLERPHATTLSLDDMVRAGVVDETLSERLKEALRARKNLVVCGGSRERRAAVVNALLRALPEGDRVVVLDGPRDLSPRREGAIVLDRAATNALGTAGASAMMALHPDVVTVGDIEAADLPVLAYLATGARPGLILSASCSADHLPDRLAAAFHLAIPTLGDPGARALVPEIVDLAVDLAAGEDGRSRVTRVAEWFEPGHRFGA
jgi:pilus assembly protein CpaF